MSLLTKTSDVKNTNVVAWSLEWNTFIDAMDNMIKQTNIDRLRQSISSIISFINFQRNPKNVQTVP